MALEGRAVLHPGGEEFAGDFNRGPRTFSKATLGRAGQRATTRNHLRFRISPEMTIAVGTTVLAQGDTMTGENVEMVASRHPRPEEMEAYERVLGDAMSGDSTLFAREDYVEEAWRIVDAALKADTPVYPYGKGTWGPSAEVEQVVLPPGGWHNPASRNRRGRFPRCRASRVTTRLAPDRFNIKGRGAVEEAFASYGGDTTALHGWHSRFSC